MSSEPASRTWLSPYAAFCALATLGLIALGGLVTSHGAGMAVPDWPTTYGYNMFLFPISQWVGGIFYEHTHRLYASFVGFLTIGLALWLQVAARPRWAARLGWAALALVIVQGVLGGLRVTLMKDQIGVVHAALAQAFLVLLTLIALFTSAVWQRWQQSAPRGVGAPAASRWVLFAAILIFLQLLVGATMRHQHAGLAIPDFPLAHGRFWPRTDEAFLQGVNALRTDARDFHPITAFQVNLHMAHRLLGMGVAVAVWVASLGLRRAFGPRSILSRLGLLWLSLVTVQILLGAATVWSNKAADVATAHVVVGAACLSLSAVGVALSQVAVRSEARSVKGSRIGLETAVRGRMAGAAQVAS